MTENLISLEAEYMRIAGAAKVLGDPSGTPAYLYARSSAKEQAVEGRESLARQLLFAHEKAYADGRYVPVDMAYWDIWRGKDADRPEFHRLLSDIKQNRRSDLIYIDQTDRLSRDTAVYYVLLHDLTRHGIKVRFESQEDDLIRHIKLAFDEIELERRRYRQIQANKARATKGYITSRSPAFGYTLSDDSRSYVVDEEKARWVKQVFDWYVSGKALRWIAKTLTGMGLPTPRGSKRWRSETMRKMLRQEVYKGTYIANRYEQVWIWEGGKQKKVHRCKPQSEWIYVAVPAIVSEEQWEEAQRLLATNRQKSLRHARKHEWLLSGILRCVCGNKFCCKQRKSKFHLASGEWKVYTYDYYRCADANRAVLPYTCTKGMIAKHRLDSFVLEALELLIRKVDLWEQVLADNSEQVDRLSQHINVYQKHIEEIDNQVEELLQIALEHRTSRTRQLFLEKQAELEKQRQGFEEQLKIAQERLLLAQQTTNRQKVVEKILDNLQTIGGLTNLPFDLKRQLLTQLVDEIILDTEACWFEIRGVLSDKFYYSDDEQLVSQSATPSALAPMTVATRGCI